MEIQFLKAVTIYGTGLMGTSFALALKQARADIRILGIDTPEMLSRSRAMGAIEMSGTGVAACDLIVLAAPVGDILNLLAELEPIAPLIMDLGSTKVDICRKAEARGLPFIGGHPMAGSERSGPEAASADLFRDSRFFLCPVSSTPPDALHQLENLVHSLGAFPHVISPETHDKLVAELSHLPQILSTVLAELTGEHRDFAGPGWKSVTRLAASPFHIWRDILLTSGSLPDELRIYIQRLHGILDVLERKDMAELEAVFQRANASALDG
jgi:prephenate dehydrogenase